MIFLVPLFSKKSPFELVKQDMEAVTYHYSRFRLGDRDLLATLCFQMIMAEAQKQEQKDD
jgi:hypothetical protein